MNYSKGLYCDPITGVSVSITQAIADGHIKVHLKGHSGGSKGAPRGGPSPKILNFMQFFEKFGKIVYWHPVGWRPPLTGNLGSVPVQNFTSTSQIVISLFNVTRKQHIEKFFEVLTYSNAQFTYLTTKGCSS